MTVALEEERAVSAKHKQVAIMLIKDRKRLLEQIADLEKRTVVPDQERNQDSQLSLQFEAAMEKHLSEFDIEREQLKGRLAREEKKNSDLYRELSQLTAQVESLTKQLSSPLGDKRLDTHLQDSKAAVQKDGGAGKIAQLGNKVYRNTPPSTPPETRRSDTEKPTPPAQLATQPAAKPTPTRILPAGSDSNVKRAIMQFSSTSPTKERTIVDKVGPEKPVEVSRGPTSMALTTSAGNTAVFTTPTGTRISLSVGGQPSPSSSSNLPRKSGGQGPAQPGRGSPPPIPPNKPAYVPTVMPGIKSVPARSSPSPAKPAPPAKFGITISKDKITISNPENSSEGRGMGAGQRPIMVGGGAGDASRTQKPSQVCLAFSYSATFG